MSKSATWVSNLEYRDINNWDIETYRTFLGLNPKLQDLLIRPDGISLSQIKALVATNLYKSICYLERCNKDQQSASNFNNLVVNTLNMQIKMIRQLYGIDLPLMELKTAEDFHNDIENLFEKATAISLSMRKEIDQRNEAVMAASFQRLNIQKLDIQMPVRLK